MDPKQEAQFLFDRFYNETLSHLSDHNTKEDARKSASICVEELIKMANYYTEGYYALGEYYEEVKQEINKL